MDNNVSAILEGLNEEQRKAVTCVEGPVLIVAGAGSGKTRVLTSRVAYLLASGVRPSQILALTFTKKAAGEMKERIARMVGSDKARYVVTGTFHAVFVRFLRQYADSLGYPEQFTIYDSSDSQSAVKACIKELGLDDKVYKPKEVLSHISMAKNNLMTVQAYRANQNLLIADTHSRKPRMIDIYDLYTRKCRQSGVMDFDDILLNMNILLRDNPAALEEISDRFEYILVDEYQDTNYSQYLILKKLSARHRRLCVVGDDSQSIYAFRGARIENILKFKDDYPEYKLFRLERNYRSTKTIVDAANSLIAHNEGRIPKNCYAVGAEGERIRLLKAYTEQEEAIMIVSEIGSRMREDGAAYQDFAVLYRTNSQSRALEEALRRRNIPYAIYSGNSFFERAEVKDMMAYFKLAVNPSDDESFKRAVNKPARGIGGTTVAAVEAAAQERGVSLFEAALTVPKVKPFCEMIGRLSNMALTDDAYAVALKIADESSLYAFYKSDTSVEGMARTANLDELLNSVKQYIEEREGEEGVGVQVTLGEFLENISLLSNVDVSEDETNNRVALMTVHAAKGLEFPYVFIAGMEENLFPGGGMLAGKEDIEEERRLFYVALTRAERSVMLSFASSRMRNGQHQSNRPSRFIREIDPSFIVNPLTRSDFETAQDDDDDDLPGMRFSSRFGGASGRSGGLFGSGGQRGENYRSGVSRPGYPQARQGFAPGRGAASAPVSPARPAVPQSKPDVIDADFVPEPMTSFKAGDRIEHNRFGKGTILELAGAVPEIKAKVAFDAFGEKLLLLKYAKMRHCR